MESVIKWHTGTPCEECWCLVTRYDGTIQFDLFVWDENYRGNEVYGWVNNLIPDIVAWCPLSEIEPYKEENEEEKAIPPYMDYDVRTKSVMEDFVPFELAKKLKEKGFIENCLAYYTNNDILQFNYSHKAGAKYSDCYLSHNLMPRNSVSGKFFDAPTISQVLKWTREEKGYHICVSICDNPVFSWCYEVVKIDGNIFCHADDGLNTYEQAAIAGITYCLDNLI